MGPGHATSTTPNGHHITAAASSFRSRPSTYASLPIARSPVPRPDSFIIPGPSTPVRSVHTLAGPLIAEKSYLQSRVGAGAVDGEKNGMIIGGGGHSRSASVQSSSSMLLQTPPGKRRHQPLSRHQASSPPAPSISIASLIHPSSPNTPTHQPLVPHHPLATVVSSSTSTPNMTASSIPSPNLSASFPESGPAAEPISALQLSVDAGEEVKRKRPIDAWFATGAVAESAEDMDVVVPPSVKNQGQSALERWSKFTLGSKRPRSSDDDALELTTNSATDRLEDSRPGKKALFVGSGRYNT
jgi:hypothetical protein